MEIKVRKDIPIPERQKPKPPLAVKTTKWFFDELKEYQDSIFVPDTTVAKARSMFAAWRFRKKKDNWLMVAVCAVAIEKDVNGKDIAGVRIWRDHDRSEATAASNSVAMRVKKVKKKVDRSNEPENGKLSAGDVRKHFKDHAGK